MLFVLIALVVMLIGGVAMIRSMNTTLFTAGNMAFKRDLANQAERVLPVVLAQLQTGALSTASSRAARNTALNYSAVILASTDRGVPQALMLADPDFNATVGSTANDIRIDAQQVTIRYVVDRMCNDEGIDVILGAARCSLVQPYAESGGSASKMDDRAELSSSGGAGAAPLQAIYRVSVRVTGPRDTQAFFQTTFAL